MQKLILTIVVVFLAAYCNATDGEIKLKTAISEVTVYQQNALVMREGSVTVPTGNSAIIIHDLNSSIRPQDVRIQSKGNFNILSISYRYKTDTLSGVKSQQEKELLSKQIQTIQSKINRENGFLDIYNKEEQMLLANQNFTHKEEGVDIDRLERASNFIRTRFFDIKNKRLEIQDNVTKWQQEINEINLKYQKIKGIETKTTLEMIVRVAAKTQVKGTFIMNYRVYNAGWIPSYDATVDKVSDPLILEYKAKVYQSTGEDWKNVDLTIATGNPNVNKKKPNLLPWYISGQFPQTQRNNYQNNQDLNAFLRSQPYNASVKNVSGQLLDQNGEALPFVNITVYGTSTGTTSDINGYYSFDVPSNGQRLQYSYIGFTTETLYVSNSVMNVILKENSIELSEMVVIEEEKSSRNLFGINRANTESYYDYDAEIIEDDFKDATEYADVTVAYSFTNTKFKIDALYDIPSDGKEYAVQIQRHEVEADYIYQCSPKLDPTAYLTAQITGWEDYNLLNGVMNIYFENAFIGQSQLDLANAEDTLSLSLGEDKNISINRKRIKSENKKQLLGNKKKVVREYEITVRNNKREGVKIIIDDQLPITTTEEIEIESETLSGGSKNELTGKVTWELDLNSGKKKVLNFKYNVKYPKNMRLKV